jgi:integron integrase
MKKDEVMEKMRAVIRRKHLALSTEESYLAWLGKYVDALKGWRVLPETAAGKMERWLSGLAERGVSASTQNQAFNAVLFFYREVLRVDPGPVNALRARVGKRERHAPTVSQVKALLADIRDEHEYPTNLICRLLYGCGLRVSEACNLRIKDFDFENSRMVIREAKRNKDRVVGLPCSLVVDLRSQIEVARRVWELDRARGVPVPLPGQLSKKYKRANEAWQWFWVFPSNGYCDHPRTGERVRYRVHEANVQKAVRESARRLGLYGAVTPHNFRHAYATHLIDRGVNIKSLAEAMGHSSIETTSGYVHASALSVPSPL